MAKYAQLHTDDGLAVLKAGLTKEYVLALTFIAQHEDVSIPVREFEKAIKKLAEIGVELSLQRAIGKTLSDNARSKRYYEKTQQKRKESHVRTDVSADVVHHTNLLHSPSPSPNPSPAEKEVARKTRKPRQPSKGKLALAEFNAAVTAVTGSPSCVTGMANETRAAAFADAIAAAGETMTDAVRRRHGLGKSLTLHWMMNDYAGDRVAKRPVNTGNHLRQPHPREIPTDPEAARVYWLGEQQDEPRFDFG